MNNEDEERFILKEKKFILKSDKNNEYEIILSINNNDILNITVNSMKIIPSKKYSLSCTLEELFKNRFFKIFINVDEIFRELETKISKSNIIEETNIIYLDIPIGLTIINDIILEIKQIEKSKDDIINELNNEINNLKNKNNLLELKLKEYDKQLNNNQEKLKNVKEINDNKEILDLIYNDYENIIEIELNSNDNEEVKIINENIFDKDKTILLINRKIAIFNNIIKLDKNKNYKIYLLNNNKLESLKDMFNNCNNISKINFIKFNSEKIEDMNSMFEKCSQLTTIEISILNTNNVQNMKNMFYKCSQLT